MTTFFVGHLPTSSRMAAIDYNMLAFMGYDAYAKQAGNKNYQGNPMPTWKELPEAQKECWRMAAATIRNTAMDMLFNPLVDDINKAKTL